MLFLGEAAMTSQQYVNQIKTYLCQQFNLGDEQVKEMMPSFISTLAGHMSNLEKALQSGDLKVLGKSGHTIKGAFLNLGLSECAEIALQIERRGKEEDRSADFAKMVARLREKIDVITSSN